MTAHLAGHYLVSPMASNRTPFSRGLFMGRVHNGIGPQRPEAWVKVDIELGGVPREQKMLKGHLPRVIYHQVY